MNSYDVYNVTDVSENEMGSDVPEDATDTAKIFDDPSHYVIYRAA
jgi:hypothetical protein